MQTSSSEPSAEEQPILLVGAERSGTTLLSLMLGGHPQIAWLGEFEYALDPHPLSGGLLDAASYRAWLPQDRRFRAQHFEMDPQLDTAALIGSFLAQTRQRAGKPQVGASLHRHLERIPRLWPGARIVHLLRDGRDVALSRMGMGWAGNPWAACGAWRDAEESWERLAADIPAERRHELRFEDLVRAPEPTLDALCRFLGLEFDPGMLRYPERSRYGPPKASAGEQWRRRCDPTDLAFVEAEIGEMLHRRGYPASGVLPRRPGPVRRAALRLQSRLHGWRFRLRRYGLGLTLAEMLARRLGLEGPRRRLQRRLDRITEESLL